MTYKELQEFKEWCEKTGRPFTWESLGEWCEKTGRPFNWESLRERQKRS